MRRLRAALAVIGIILVGLVLATAISLSATGPRSALVRAAIKIVLFERGRFHLAGGAIRVESRKLVADDLAIDDRDGGLVFSAKRIVIRYDPSGLIGRTSLRLGLEAVEIDRPALRMVRLETGEFNISPALPKPGALARPSPTIPFSRFHYILRVREGRVNFENPSALNSAGRFFAVVGISGALKVDQGGLTTGNAQATLLARRRLAPLHARLFENDQSGFAQAEIRARGVPVAPIIDGLLPSPVFAVESGIADGVLGAFAVDYDTGGNPVWRIGAHGTVRDGTLRVRPLIAPVVGLHGPVRFDGAIVTTTGLRGVANGVPLTVRGGIVTAGGVQFALEVFGVGPLARVRKLFAFSQRLPLGGALRANVRIAGTLNELDVSGTGAATTLVAYGGIPISDAAAEFFYRQGHFSMQRIALTYDVGRLFGDGDIDLGGAEPNGSFEFAGAIPASQIPIAANLNPRGVAETLFVLNGPLLSLSGSGFAQIARGNGVSVRTNFVAGPERFAIGPAIIAMRGGELAVAGGIDRLPQRVLYGDLIATHAPLRLMKAAVGLPGVGSGPLSLPQSQGVVDGVVVLRGNDAEPQVVVEARAERLRIADARLGSVRLVAGGVGRRVRIGVATIEGEDARLTAGGFASVSPRHGMFAAVISGNGRADLGRIGALGAARGLAGHANGDFKAVLASGRWVVTGRARSHDATYDGVRVAGARAIMGGTRRSNIFAATVSAAGGRVAAIGAPSVANPGGRAVYLWASDVDLRALQPLGIPLDGGTAVAIGEVAPGKNVPTASGAVALSGTSFHGREVGGDAQVRYADGVLRGTGNISIDRERAAVAGMVEGLWPGRAASSATLDVAADLRDADVGALVNRYLPPSVQIAGTGSGQLHVGGTFFGPTLDGPVHSDTGTIRGVTYDEFRGVVHIAQGRLGIDSGSVRFGTSRVSFGGLVSPNEVHVSTASPGLDLTDFNDFFQGYDTLEGRGFVNAAFDITPRTARATGHVSLRNTSLAGFPVGAVDADLASRGGALLADVRAQGPAGSANVSGTVTLPQRRAGTLDFSRAAFDVTGRLARIDLAVVAPHVGAEDYKLAGLLDARGYARGRLGQMAAQANFALRDGHVGKVPIDSFAGTVTSSAGDVALRDTTIRAPFASANLSATRYRSGQLAGRARLDARDLSKVSALAGQPQALSGRATADVALGGTSSRPVVQTALQSGRGALYGVAFDRFAARTKFAPGEFEIGDSELVLSGGAGSLTLRGSLPLQLRPFGLGPRQKPIALRLDAKAVQLAALNPLARDVARLRGTLNARVSASGHAGHPEVAGSAQLRAMGIESKWETTPITGVDADLSLAHEAITLEKARGNVGAGTFEARGAAHIIPAVGLLKVAGLQYWTHLVLRNAQINVPGWIGGAFDGDLSLTKSGATPYLAGAVTMHDGAVPFPAIYGLATRFSGMRAPAAPSGVPGVPKLRPGHVVVYGGEIYGGQHVMTSGPLAQPTPVGFILPLLDLNVATTAGKNVRVKGGGMDLAASGNVVIGGNLRSPTLAGAFTSTRGQVTYFDTNFRLLRGSVVFDPAQGLLPTLDVTARTYTGDEDITLVITGRIDNLRTDFSADPPLSRDQILATLLHEPQVASALESTPDQTQSALLTEAQTYFTAQLTRGLLFPFEEALAQSLNFEQIFLTFDPQGRVILEVRKLVSPKVAGIYRTTLTAPVTQTYGVAYSVRSDAAVELFQSQTPVAPQAFLLDVRLTFH